jgi:hypothetical protein
MLILKKKKCLWLAVLSLFLLTGLFLSRPVSALSTTIRQVKTKNSAVIYFLNHKTHTKKAYLNTTAYLSYGNKLSDIKLVTATELKKWPDYVLFKTASSSAIYYIHGRQKSLIHSVSDLSKFNLRGRPILEVSPVDLNQYTLATYQEIGLEKKVVTDQPVTIKPVTPPAPSEDTSTPPIEPDQSTTYLSLTSETVVNTSTILGAGNLAANTQNNLLGIFDLQAGTADATITRIAFNLTGVYGPNLVTAVNVRDSYNLDYSSVNWRGNDHQVIVNFPQPLSLAAGESQVFKIYADLAGCPNCTNQSFHLELPNASVVSSSRPVQAVWPLRGEEYKIIDGSSIFGAVRAEEEGLALEDFMVNNGGRTIGRYQIFEDSGRETALIKRLVFSNAGTANKNDWNNFRLLQDGTVIARSSDLTSDGRIAFDISSLQISSSTPAELTITAELKDGYSTSSSFGLQLDELKAVGKTYNFELYPQINNLTETYILN